MTKLICKIKSEPGSEVARTLRMACGDLAVVAKIDGRSDTSKLPASLIVIECPAVEVRTVMGDGTPTVDYPRQVPDDYARFFLHLAGPLYCDDLPLTNGLLTVEERKAVIASLRDRDKRMFETGKSYGVHIAEARSENTYNPDSHLANYTPNDPICPICNKSVEPQHSKFRDTITGTIAHDYCFRTESAEHFQARRRDAVAAGNTPVYGPARWA